MDRNGHRDELDSTDVVPGAVTEAMLRFVHEASRTIRNLPGDTATLEAAVRACVPRLADVAVAVLADGGKPHLVVQDVDPARQPTVRGMLRRHGDELLKLTTQIGTRYPPGRPLWLPSVSDPVLRRATGGGDVLPHVLRTLGVRSLILLPLRAEARHLGILVLGRIGDLRPYSAGELAGAMLFARRTALTVVEARLGTLRKGDDPDQAELRASAAKWAGVFEQAPWGAAVFDSHDLRIEAVNPALADLFGVTDRQTLLGQPVMVLLPEAERADFAARLADPEQGHAIDTVLRRADGTTFPGLVSLATLPETPESPGFRMLNVQDLTELKRTHGRLLQAQRMEAVGRLAGGIAHEVNNMMTIIMGFSDLLLGAQDLSPQERGDIAEIQKAARRAGGITQQLLAFSRQQMLMPTVIDLNELIQSMAILLRPLLPANVHLEVRPAQAPVRARADRAQLEQVIINLAFNARDALPRGGRIELRTAHRGLDAEMGQRQIGVDIPPGAYAVLEIADTGVGMDEPTRQRVFEPFFTTKPAGQGTGLGLSTVYGIVKQSGGFVWVNSAPDRGTMFTIAFPEAGEGAAAAAPSPALAPRALGPATVLVVEDEPGVRDLAVRLLRQDGHQVHEASHGFEALAVLAAKGPAIELVIADVVMPDMGGADLSHRLRELGLDIPVLYMSGYTRDEVLERQLIQPDAAFLQKPFTAEELASAVRDLLTRPEAKAVPGERPG